MAPQQSTLLFPPKFVGIVVVGILATSWNKVEAMQGPDSGKLNIAKLRIQCTHKTLVKPIGQNKIADL